MAAVLSAAASPAMSVPLMTSSDIVTAKTAPMTTKRVKFVRRKKVPYYDPAEYEALANIASPSSPSASTSSSPASTLLATPPAGSYARLPTPTGTPHYQKRSNTLTGTPSKRDSNAAADGLLVYLYSQQLTLSSKPSAKVHDLSRPTVSKTTPPAAPTQPSSRPRIHSVRRKTVPKVTDYSHDDVVIAQSSDAFSAYSLWSMAADAYPDIADVSPHVSPKTLTKSLRSTPSMAVKNRNGLYGGANARRPSTVAMSSASSSDSQSTISSRTGSTESLSQRSSFSSQGGAADSAAIAEVDFVTKMGFGHSFDEEPWGQAI